MLLKAICRFVKGCNIPAVPVPVSRDYADKGVFANGSEPPAFEYIGKRIWTSKDEWSASAPFVGHYVLRRSHGGPIVVDEINWWPLVFPLQCRNIMPGEPLLAGPGAALLNLCSLPEEKDSSHPRRFKTYTWLNPDQAKTLESIRPKGALINRDVKNSILDWGFSDAIMAVGSLHDLLTEGMRQLLVESVRFNADGSKTNDGDQRQPNRTDGVNSEFIIVSHSLGSYLVFSALKLGPDDGVPNDTLTSSNSDAAKEDSAARYILERTSLVYFFANQLALLELANVAEPSAAALPLAGGPAKPWPLSSRMIKWKNLRLNYQQRHNDTDKSAAKPPQVIAWSDPSDLLGNSVSETVRDLNSPILTTLLRHPTQTTTSPAITHEYDGSGTPLTCASTVTDARPVRKFPAEIKSAPGLKFAAFGSTLYKSYVATICPAFTAPTTAVALILKLPTPIPLTVSKASVTAGLSGAGPAIV